MMRAADRSELRVGMLVFFGRPNGEKTKGRIERLNPAKAVIITLEARGIGHPAGQEWKVPYSMIYVEALAIPGGLPATIQKPVLKFNPFSGGVRNHTMLAINAVYSALSPEHLSGDGELPRGVVIAKSRELNQQLRLLQQVMGVQVSEEEALDWHRDYLRAQAKEENSPV